MSPRGRVPLERVQVSTAYGSGPEGGNSAWVLPESGIVVDPGPPGDAAFESLESGLADVGLDLAEVETVVATHWHVDHAGLAPRLADAADATLHMHERDTPLVGDYAAEREGRVDRDAATLERWGVPREHVDQLREADSPSPMPETHPVEALADGDRVGPLRVVHAPGHTAGHVALALASDEAADDEAADDEGAGGDGTSEGRRVLVGDAVLRTVTPNVGGGDTRQEQPLAAYRDALDALDAAGDRALPGHGTAFELESRIAELRAHHRERSGLVRSSLTELDADATDGVSPWAVARDRFGEMENYHVKFGAGEAAAHLVDLDALGLAECVANDPDRYTVASPADGGAAALLDAVWRVAD